MESFFKIYSSRRGDVVKTLAEKHKIFRIISRQKEIETWITSMKFPYQRKSSKRALNSTMITKGLNLYMIMRFSQ